MAVGKEDRADTRLIWRFFSEPSWELNPFLTGWPRQSATRGASCESQEGTSLGPVSLSYVLLFVFFLCCCCCFPSLEVLDLSTFSAVSILLEKVLCRIPLDSYGLILP